MSFDKKRTISFISIFFVFSVFVFAEVDQNLRVANSTSYPFGSINVGTYYRLLAGFAEENYNPPYDWTHEGEDWNYYTYGDGEINEPVYSVANGLIIYAGAAKEGGCNDSSPIFGGVIYIEHTQEDGTLFYSKYAHLRKIYRNKGYVRRGELIGSFGCSSGGNVHLHWEMHKPDLWTYVDNHPNVSLLPSICGDNEWCKKARFWPSNYTESKTGVPISTTFSEHDQYPAYDTLAEWIRTYYHEPSAFVNSHMSTHDVAVDDNSAIIVGETETVTGEGGTSWHYFDGDVTNSSAEWRPDFSSSGYYEVFVGFMTYSDQQSTQYIVIDGRGREYLPILIDQKQDFGVTYSETGSSIEKTSSWKEESLGIYHFSIFNILNSNNKVQLLGSLNYSGVNIDTIIFRYIGPTLTNVFPDVNTGDWYAPFVRDLYKRNIINGESRNSNGNFYPADSIKRGEFLKWCVLGARLPFRTDGTPFNDVPTTHTLFKYIQTAKNRGFVTGCSVGYFCPDNSLNRAEAAKIIVEVFQLGTPQANELRDLPYSDVTNKAEWYYPYVQRVTDLRIFHGYEDGTFKPGGTINKAEAAKIVSRQIRNNEIQYFGVSSLMDLIPEHLF